MTHFYIERERKRVGRELNGGETERERVRERERDRMLKQKGYAVGNKLDCWTNIYGRLRTDNTRYYQDEY